MPGGAWGCRGVPGGARGCPGVPGGALRQGHGLPAWHVHGDFVLALVVLESDVGLPLAFEMPLLGGDAIRTAKQGVATEVLVTLLDEAEPRFIPHQPMVHQFLQGGIDVALALEQLIPNRNATLSIAHHAHRTAHPVVDAKGIVALKQARVAALVPPEQARLGTPRVVGRVGEHDEGFLDREFATAQRDHADAGADVVIEHDDGVLRELPQHPVAQRGNAHHRVGHDGFLQRNGRILVKLAFRHEQGGAGEQSMTGHRARSTAAQDDQAQAQGLEFRPKRPVCRVR